MNRIEEIAKLISPYKKIADIGCDHGILIAKAFEKWNIEKAIAVDNKIGPLNRAKDNLKNKSYYNDIRFSLSNGIEDIDLDTEVVVIAGMGGIMIVDILKNDLKNVKRIITQANRDNYLVRKYICSIGFDIVDELLLEISGIYYQIVVFDKLDDNLNNNRKYDDIEYEYGPLLIKNNEKLFTEMLSKRLDVLLQIVKKTPNPKNEMLKEISNLKYLLGKKEEDNEN